MQIVPNENFLGASCTQRMPTDAEHEWERLVSCNLYFGNIDIETEITLLTTIVTGLIFTLHRHCSEGIPSTEMKHVHCSFYIWYCPNTAAVFNIAFVQVISQIASRGDAVMQY